MNPPETPRRLGRGLDALLARRDVSRDPVPSTGPAETKGRADTEQTPQNALRTIPISQIRANPYQPRHEFNPEDLADLESSLRVSGLLQPITVRPAPSGTGYELIAGERRFRAATRLGWNEIPAIVRETDDRTLLTLAMVENLQRADLDPIEEADGYLMGWPVPPDANWWQAVIWRLPRTGQRFAHRASTSGCSAPHRWLPSPAP